MKILKLILIAIISLTISTQSSLAGKIGDKTMRAISFMEVKEAQKLFSDQTIIMKRPKDYSGYKKDVRGVPISGTFVAYLASNGSIFAWSKDDPKVISGVWKVTMTKENKPRMIFCMRFGEGPKKVPCMIVRYMDGVIFDSEKGNIFNLRSGSDVPAALPYTRSLKTIQNKLK